MIKKITKNKMENKKAQLKVQQMAFVLVAIVIFFVLVALIYFSISTSSLKKEAASLEADKASQMVQKLSGIPELKWTGDCDTCIDLDKALLLKNRTVYQGFFGLDYLSFEILYPNMTKTECTTGNYPNCNTVTLIQKGEMGTPLTAYAAFCRWDQDTNNEKCVLGLISATGNALTS